MKKQEIKEKSKRKMRKCIPKGAVVENTIAPFFADIFNSVFNDRDVWVCYDTDIGHKT